MAINRSAEAMTIFSVVQAGLFPIIHMGRPWLAYWVLPIPNQFGSLWVNFNSPLLWDVFAISTYLSVSCLHRFKGILNLVEAAFGREDRNVPVVPSAASAAHLTSLLRTSLRELECLASTLHWSSGHEVPTSIAATVGANVPIASSSGSRWPTGYTFNAIFPDTSLHTCMRQV